jgi:two-component system chemotaxis response regulator CheY
LARKILLADDSVTAQNMGRKILADAGYEVITVNNGSAALKKIAELKPDLIVLDVYMPGYSGLEVCQRLKETGDTSRIPVLLTVGKLEPFKPEEAKRARADGFIVKPFEASELLGALAKLEDKIVPRSEGSKPGRFARSIAAIEEGRYDKNTAPENEDSGWKNRINFPAKKAKSSDQERSDEPAIYNAVNKDLKTVVDHRSNASPPADAPAASSVEKLDAGKVDLGALSALGLPKDVTPEEIAALAAAAAQVQGISPFKNADVSEVSPARPGLQENISAEAATPAPVAKEDQGTTKDAVSEVARADAKSEIPEEKPEPTPVPSNEEKSATPDTATALTAQTPEATPVTHAVLAQPESGNGAATFEPAVASSEKDEPVTMAVAARSEAPAVASRWSAVAVALAPEESAVSLENEMQKAFAAFAAADGGRTQFVAPAYAVIAGPAVPQPSAIAAAEPESSTTATTIPVAETSQSQVAAASSDLPGTEVAQSEIEQSEVRTSEAKPSEVKPSEVSQSETNPSPEAVASAVTESVKPTVKEFETVAAAYSGHASSAFPEPAPQAPKETQAYPAFEAPDGEAAASPTADLPKNEDTLPGIAEAASTTKSLSSVDHANPETTEEPTAKDPAHAVPETHGKPESDIAASTAAAWANWRRVRESDDTRPTAYEQDAAAMAAAAGAESTPDTSSASTDTEVASLVDSVLADLRPKIVEEIARKLGKKK